MESVLKGGEEAETATATPTEVAVSSPEDKSSPSSPKEESAEETKPEAVSNSNSSSNSSSPTEETTAPAPAEEKPATPKDQQPAAEPAPIVEAPAPAVAVAAPAPVVVAPAALPESKVEVSPGATSQPIAAPATDITSTSTSTTTSSSITEKKTTEETCLLHPSVTSASASATPVIANTNTNTIATTAAFALPSSPPPTPVDPSPLQRAQQVAPSASVLAEALKLPHETQQRQDRDDGLAQAPSQDSQLAQEVQELEDSLQRSLDCQKNEPKILDDLELLDEELPPPLPVSPVPAEASRIASFAATTMQDSVTAILDGAHATILPEEALKPLPVEEPSALVTSEGQTTLPTSDELLCQLPTPPTSLSNTSPLQEEKIERDVVLDEQEHEIVREEKLQQETELEKDQEPTEHLQKPEEPEPAPVLENNVAAKNEILPTENGISDEAPKSPPPAVPVEAPQPAPAITEDVASVTKAIEEIDISEKAVAAAVNENIESTGKNEIVADSIHQNNLNE